jgi:hypothetical protein
MFRVKAKNTFKLEMEAARIEYKLPFRPEVDPGPAFWEMGCSTAAVSGKRSRSKSHFQAPEVEKEAVDFTEESAKQALQQLYNSGSLPLPENRLFIEAGETKKLWSRRIHVWERVRDAVCGVNSEVKNPPWPTYAKFSTKPYLRHLFRAYAGGQVLDLPARITLTHSLIDHCVDMEALQRQGDLFYK